MARTHADGSAYPRRAIYCIADRRYFLGAVALINSLRLSGNGEPVFVLDCGLDDEQRTILTREATLIPADPTVSEERLSLPFLMRARAPLANPAQTMLLLDCDIVVTRSLDPLFEQGEQGKVVAFADALPQRFSPRWESELGLPSIRQQPYVNTGCIVLPLDPGRDLLERLDQSIPLVDASRSFWRAGNPDDPFFFLDQDIMNALLGSVIRRDELIVLGHELAPHPPFDHLACDPATLTCVSMEGENPFLLHHVMQKPWLDFVAPNPYTALLGRLLLGSDVPLRLGATEVPLRLRSGGPAAVARSAVVVHTQARRLRRALRLRRSRAAAAT